MPKNFEKYEKIIELEFYSAAVINVTEAGK